MLLHQLFDAVLNFQELKRDIFENWNVNKNPHLK